MASRFKLMSCIERETAEFQRDRNMQVVTAAFESNCGCLRTVLMRLYHVYI